MLVLNCSTRGKLSAQGHRGFLVPLLLFIGLKSHLLTLQAQLEHCFQVLLHVSPTKSSVSGLPLASLPACTISWPKFAIVEHPRREDNGMRARTCCPRVPSQRLACTDEQRPEDPASCTCPHAESEPAHRLGPEGSPAAEQQTEARRDRSWSSSDEILPSPRAQGLHSCERRTCHERASAGQQRPCCRVRKHWRHRSCSRFKGKRSLDWRAHVRGCTPPKPEVTSCPKRKWLQEGLSW